ncbi:30S ribosomal protein S9 [Leptospira wolffii]|uniref:Small ribosomal subunit protein uS9 n=1 Tax=Leptospira wolffii TaxID=409998 RepID=A0A2M9ZGX1_9LEPT|nr:30S ribosomal protein S9 [Leptospira wolffii]EPG64243.1 ribosomal protein S9 [Leptospira wolffii serovar Khorat str. Khorat-H2]PJZ67679.1 30S ribosomal protein S9 [Leptospira wolffii]TGK62688.1 30S ribosomal protein S9 [Leptospira wolffii]TGK73925.1 30S ribosomal protein S9 [Leptospira wolffii]TGK75080.1 30S ribosomal protein S9 [Leptospira wolffii]
MASAKEIWAVGRRKNAIARVKLKEGSGKIIVNDKDIKDYLHNSRSNLKEALTPLTLLNVTEKFDLKLIVSGGGVIGQVGAIRHALSRVVCRYNPEFRPIVKKEGLLTRDPRMVERKKYGLHKARRGTQFSKR